MADGGLQSAGVSPIYGLFKFTSLLGSCRRPVSPRSPAVVVTASLRTLPPGGVFCFVARSRSLPRALLLRPLYQSLLPLEPLDQAPHDHRDAGSPLLGIFPKS